MKTLRMVTAGLLAVGGAVIVTVSLAGTGEGQGGSRRSRSTPTISAAS